MPPVCQDVLQDGCPQIPVRGRFPVLVQKGEQKERKALWPVQTDVQMGPMSELADARQDEIHFRKDLQDVQTDGCGLKAKQTDAAALKTDVRCSCLTMTKLRKKALT